RATRTATRAQTAGRALVLLGTGAAMAAVALVAADAHASGAVSGPLVGLLVLLPLALGEVAGALPEAAALSARCAAARDRLTAIEQRTPRVIEPTDPASTPAGSTLDFQEVAVGWGERPAVAGLQLRIAPGERVALVGPSGSGKSTVAAAAMRYLMPQAGTIRLGEADLARLPGDVVRERVGLVDDDPHLFASTVVENVRLARPEADDAEVEQALRTARLGAWLDALPDGLDTWIGDGHADVSGGERARLAIARCLLADQPVIVLDEPVAHLDHATAEQIAAEMLGRVSEDGAADRAVLWITHDPVGLDRVDRVIALAAEDRQPVGAGGRLAR
ncbi:ABC transporter ATP-binding protein, partial [Nocardioides sp. BGMRC 2183]